MIVLVLIPVWIAVISVVVGLCAAARTGDAQLVGASRLAGDGSTSMRWEPLEPGDIAVRARTRTLAGEGGGSLAPDSVAA